MEILISMCIAFLIGFSAGYQRAQKKQKRINKIKEQAIHQQKMQDIESILREDSEVAVMDENQQQMDMVLYSCTREGCRFRKNGVIKTSIK